MNKKTLIATRNKLIAHLPFWTEVIRGSLMNYRTKCGNKRCPCHTHTKHRHGPYHYLVVHKGKGKQRLYLIPPEKLDSVRRGKQAYDELWAGIVKIAEINLLLLKAAGGNDAGKPKSVTATNK